MPEPADALALARWRLVLGRFSDRRLGGCPFPDTRGPGPGPGRGEARTGDPGSPGNYDRMERVLDHLYGREYAGRGVRGKGRDGDGHGHGDGEGDPDDARTGGTGDSVLSVPDWLHDVHALFPREAAEVLERHALDRYGMTELVTDEAVLKAMEPSYELLKAVLAFRHLMSPRVLEVARGLVRKVVEELQRTLAREVRPVLWGRLNRQRRTRLKVARNLDALRTIRENLKYYDAEKKRLVVRSLLFFSRVEHHLPWHIIMAVDCSGSMTDSVIHSAVMAGIFRALPSLRVSLVAFDTAVIDLTDQADDPVAVLMGVQLGGGTDIAGALGYCETLIRTPTRTVVIVVTDFFEGGPPDRLVAAVKRMREAGAKVLGLAALDAGAEPVYDHQMAERCVAAGAEVAALTPRRLAGWMARVLS